MTRRTAIAHPPGRAIPHPADSGPAALPAAGFFHPRRPRPRAWRGWIVIYLAAAILGTSLGWFVVGPVLFGPR